MRDVSKERFTHNWFYRFAYMMLGPAQVGHPSTPAPPLRRPRDRYGRVLK